MWYNIRKKFLVVVLFCEVFAVRIRPAGVRSLPGAATSRCFRQTRASRFFVRRLSLSLPFHLGKLRFYATCQGFTDLLLKNLCDSGITFFRVSVFGFVQIPQIAGRFARGRACAAGRAPGGTNHAVPP